MSSYLKKILLVTVTVSALIIFLPIFSSAAAVDVYEGDDLCYSPSGIVSGVTASNMGDYVTFTAVNNDPYIHLRATTASIADKYILIKYRTSISLGGQLYFKSAEPCVLFNWNGNDEWNTIILDATAAGTNWNNKSIFRLDPLHSHTATVSGNSIDIEYIGFFSSESEAIKYEQEREANKEFPEHTDSSFTFSRYGSGYGVSGCTTSEYVITIPENYSGLPVTHIYSGAFSSAERLKYLYIPPTVTSIQSNTFNSSTQFTLVGVAGSTAESYAKSAGADFIAVTDPSNFIFEVENNQAKIVGYTGTASNVVLPLFHMGYKVTSVGEGAFENSTDIRAVTVVYCIETIGKHAFYSSEITSLSLGESVKYIEKSAFSECTSLSSVSLKSVKNINDFAFFNCTSLTSISLPDSLESVGQRAFAQTALKNITIPANLYSLNRYAFLKCSSLSAIYVNANNSKFSAQNGILYDYSKDTVYICPEGKTGTVTLNANTEIIGRGAFINCDLLRGIDLSNITAINAFAFYDCDKLTAVDVPATVKTVNEYAFSECASLVIRCYISTEIQFHCKEFSIPCEIIYTEFTVGDANGDGIINGKDMIRVKCYIIDSKTALIKDAADIDGDGDIDNNDLIKLRDMILSKK